MASQGEEVILHTYGLGGKQFLPDRDELCLDRLDLGDDAIEREDLRIGHERLAEPVHMRRRGSRSRRDVRWTSRSRSPRDSPARTTRASSIAT